MKFECQQPPKFKCPACPYRAKQKSTVVSHILNRHRDLHIQKYETYDKVLNTLVTFFSAPAKFTCDTCGKGYKHQASFSRHKKYECQKAPTFACGLCVYKAKRRSDLKKHIKSRHPDSNCQPEEVYVVSEETHV
nr:unnamed protein product [Callosobruchus analis]